MDIKAMTSGIEVKFTPDEWPTVQRILAHAVKEIEEQNAAFIELMRQNPDKSPRLLEDELRNPLFRPTPPVGE